jgi:hypothetical protein
METAEMNKGVQERDFKAEGKRGRGKGKTNQSTTVGAGLDASFPTR